jgi:hypothetical protein
MQAVLAEVLDSQQDADEDVDFQFKGKHLQLFIFMKIVLSLRQTKRIFLNLTSKVQMKKMTRMLEKRRLRKMRSE